GKVQLIRDYREPGGTPLPPRPLGEHGQGLWNRIMAEYGIRDSGGQEILCQACQALDVAEALAATVREEGLTVATKFTRRAHPAIREELVARAFGVRALEKLGVATEVVKPVGRPPRGFGWTREAD